MSPRGLALALAGTAALAAAAPAAAPAMTIYAHRGGTVVDGKAAYGEETMPAFAHTAKLGAGVELDVHLTKDGIPIAIHDGTFDRTTTCNGPVDALTFAQVRARCRVDVLGVAGNTDGMPSRKTAHGAPVPSLADVLAFARAKRLKVSAEIANYPTYPDYDSSPRFATAVMGVFRRSKIARSSVVIESFLTANLDAARKLWPGVATSAVTFAGQNQFGLDTAAGRYTWLSPQWPVSGDYVAQVKAKGSKVVPYTPDTPAEVRAAKAAGVDAIITDDPSMAKRALQ